MTAFDPSSATAFEPDSSSTAEPKKTKFDPSTAVPHEEEAGKLELAGRAAAGGVVRVTGDVPFLAGGLAGAVGASDTADKLFRAYDKSREVAANIEGPAPTSIGGRVAQAVGALPGGIASLGANSLVEPAANVVKEGGDLPEAYTQLGLNTAANVAGLGIGSLGKTVAQRVIQQGAASGALNEAARVAGNLTRPSDRQQEFDPVELGINVGAGAGLGAVMRPHPNAAPGSLSDAANAVHETATPTATAAPPVEPVATETPQPAAEAAPAPANPVAAEAPAPPDTGAQPASAPQPEPIAPQSPTDAAILAQRAAPTGPLGDAAAKLPTAAEAVPVEMPESTATAASDTATAAPFTPEERHAARLDDHLAKLGDITPEQRQAVIEHHGDVELDPVMNIPTRKDLAPSLEAARGSGQPAAYGEIDVGNVGGLNAKLGSNSAADPHLKAVADIVDRNLQEAAKAAGGEAVLVRKGGDELGAITKGMDADTLHAALDKARGEVAQYAVDNGLENYPNPKKITPEFPEGKPEGLGLQFGVAENTKARTIGETITEADQLVEKRKKGASYEQRGQNEPLGPGASSGTTGSGAEGSAGAGAREVGSGPRIGEGQAARPAAETGGETAVAEPPTQTAPERAKPAPTAETTITEQPGTQVRNAAVDEQRDKLGLSELPPAEREHWQDASDKAASDIVSGDIRPRALAAEVAAKPRALTTTETMALAHDLKALSDEHANATRDALAARESGDTARQTQALLRQSAAVDAMETNHAALRNGGTEAARSLSIRNAILKDDYTVGRNMDRARLAFGDKFNATLKAQVEDLSAQLKKAQERAAKIEADATARAEAVKARRAAERMTPAEKAQAAIQRQLDRLQKTIAERLKACPI